MPPTASDPSPEPIASTPEIFPPSEEAELLTQSTYEKTSANKIFSTGDYSSAIQGYEKALATCPTYLEYDIAVLRSNIAACHLKLAEWKEAVESATQALEALDRVDPPSTVAGAGAGAGAGGGNGNRIEEKVAEIEEVDDATEVRISALSRTGHSIQDVHKLRTKALLRRAKARREVGGWASLQGSLEDYQMLSRPPCSNSLTGMDQKTVQSALRELPPKLEETKNNEMAEMMGKLKGLGNSILKPFGLSTENFQFTKDEKSGGYSMNFNQGGS
jgi:tetratricopeptide (TPR) repeat protein